VWLRAVGFREDPFGVWEAGREDHLSEYFVAPSYFDDILGDASEPRTTFVAAERGCGKSANRRMIEYYCRQKLASDKILAVPHTDLTRLVGSLARKVPVTVEMHVQEIVRQGLRPLLQWIQDHPSTIEEMSDDHWNKIKWFLVSFDPFRSQDTDQRLREFGIESETIARRLRQALCPDVPLIEMFYVDLLAAYMEVVKAANVEVVYVLVDGVDELGTTAADPKACVALLEPLVSNLRVMEFKRIAFKFFLTPVVAQLILELPTVREDRFVYQRVEWSNAELANLLRARLEAFSDGRVSSLDPICSPDLRRLDELLVQYSQSSPRNMLRLGHLVLSEHAKHSLEEQGLLTRKDFDAGMHRFSVELAARSIQINRTTGELFVQGKLVPLTPLESKLFTILYEKKGTCTKEEIVESLYENKDVNILEALDQVMLRLRKTLRENEATRSIEITTVRGRGYKLTLPDEQT